MHWRRLACFLAGLWLAGSIWMDFVAIENFRSVDRFLAEPGVRAAVSIHDLGRDATRTLMRREIGESNRWYFEQWEYAELGLGLCLVLVLVFGSNPQRFVILLAAAAVLVVGLDRILLTPQITRLGRVLDYATAAEYSENRTQFWTFHGIYSALEMVKLALLAGLSALLMLKSRPDRKKFVREYNQTRQSGAAPVPGAK